MQVSSGAALLKANQAVWLGKAAREMTARAGESCWEKTGLLDAWKESTQREAMPFIQDLFSNVRDLRMSDAAYADIASEMMEPEATSTGRSLTEIAEYRADSECALACVSA